MKGKLILHYLLSFLIACVIIAFINIVFMRSSISNMGAMYNYKPEKMINEFKDYIYISQDNKVLVSSEGIKFLKADNIGLQILDESNNEIFSYNKPSIATSHYSNVSLIDMYTNDSESLFVGEKNIDDITYTYLLFLNPNKVNRVVFSYDVDLMQKAHRFPLLIILNIILILTMSFLFTVRITKPINRIIDKIVDLSNGNYSMHSIKDGIYFQVENNLNQLANKLQSSEDERKELENMREEWISKITHDIKTPLTSIMGNAEIMGDINYPVDDKTRAKYCNTIIKKSEYIKTLVEDLNLSTRLKNNALVINKKEVNMVSLIRHVLIDIINDEKYNHNNISFNYSQDKIICYVDEQLMKRVFVNIIINAFVHNNNDVKIKININQTEDNYVNIVILDNGRGVSKEELNNIFKRYYRGTHTRNKIEGSGLGMAIAHDIIVSHGADILASSNQGEGLTLQIKFKT